MRRSKGLSLVLLTIGALLVLSAGLTAAAIPDRAVEDYRLFQNPQHLSAYSIPHESDVYFQMSYHSRMLQNAYIGVSGLILLIAGTAGLLASLMREDSHQ